MKYGPTWSLQIPPGGPGMGGATGTGGATAGGAGNPGTAEISGAAGVPGTAGVAGASAGTGMTGAGGMTGPAGGTGAAGTNGASAGAGAGTSGTGGAPTVQRSWPTVDCVGGPCAAPNVCVNLDFLFVACVPCGGNDQVCCPPYADSDPFLGTCDAGLICAANPNFQSDPPTDVVTDVCQIPGSPPPADGGLNHERLDLFP